jgi:hypothetical protein
VGILAWSWWLKLRGLLWRSWRRPPVMLTPRLREFASGPEELASEDLLKMGFLHPVYLEISVLNTSTWALSRVVGKVKLIAPDKRELDSHVAWSQEPGEDFVPTGPLEVEISGGSERVARLAVAYLSVDHGWFGIDRKDPTPTGHFGADMNLGKDIKDDGIGPRCLVELTLQADRYAPYVARLPVQIQERSNGVGHAEIGTLETP